MNSLIYFMQDTGIWAVPILGTLIISALCLGLWTLFVGMQNITKSNLVKVLATPLLFALPVSLVLLTILICTGVAVFEVNDAVANCPPDQKFVMMAAGMSKILYLQVFLVMVALFSGCSLAICALIGLLSKNKKVKQVLPWGITYSVCGILALGFMIQTGHFWPLIGSIFLLACSTSMFPKSEESNANFSQFGATLLGGIFLTSLLSFTSAWEYLEMFDAFANAPADQKGVMMRSGLQYHDGITYVMIMYFLAFIPSVVSAFKMNTGKIQSILSMVVVPLAMALLFFPNTKSTVTMILEESIKQQTIEDASEIFQEGKEQFKKVFTVQNQSDLPDKIKTAHTKFSEAYSIIPTSPKYKAYLGYTTFYVNKDSDPKAAEKGLTMLLEVTGGYSKQTDDTIQNNPDSNRGSKDKAIVDEIMSGLNFGNNQNPQTWEIPDWKVGYSYGERDDYDDSSIAWVLLSRIYQEQGKNELAISILSDLVNTEYAPAVAELSILEQRGSQTVVSKTIAPKSAAKIQKIDTAMGECSDGINKTALKYLSQVKTCHDISLKSNPAVAGRVEIEIEIMDGKVSVTNMIKNTTGDSKVGSCIEKKIRRWKFPTSCSDIAVLPFALNPKN